MYIELENLKKHFPNTIGMEGYAATLPKDEPTIVLRNDNEPTTPYCH